MQNTSARTSPVSLITNFATVWASGLVVRSLLFELVTGSPLPASSMRWPEQAGLFCFRLISTVPGTLLVAACYTAMQRSANRPPRVRTIVVACCWAVPLTLALVSFTSWAAFYATGQFMGTEAWTLALSSPSLLIDHVMEIEPIVLVAIPAFAIAIVIANERLCRWTSTWSAGRARGMSYAVFGALVCALAAAYLGDLAAERDNTPVANETTREMEMPHEAYVRSAMDKSGPVARLLVDAFHAVTLTTLRAARWAGSGESGHRMISPSDYARRAPAGAPRLSVIVVLVESLRRDELSAEGGPRDVMPSVDALAREATVYTDAVAPAAQSDFATTSVLSSQFPLRYISFHPFPPHVPYPRVLPWDILKPLGYRTAVFSSQNEYWAGMYNFLQTGSVDYFLHAETFNGRTYSANVDRGLHEWMEKTGHAGKIDDSDTIDEAIAWTDSIARTAPFFAYINLQSSHTPYVLTRHFAPRFGSGRVSFPILFDVFPADSARAVRDLYDNSLAYADAQLGRLFDALKRSGRWKSTVVVVLGDHGEAFYEHGFGAHGSELYGEVTHVPLIIRVPSQRAVRDTLPASTIDVMPTVLGILGLPRHPAHQGINLANRAARVDRPEFSLTQTAMADEVGVEQDQWKLIYDVRHSVTRLYDLRNDPGESHDIAGSDPADRDALMGTMAAWWARQIGYYEQLPAKPAFYAPDAPVAVPLAEPKRR
jgi:arylsulfatase A-like enzyme